MIFIANYYNNEDELVAKEKIEIETDDVDFGMREALYVAADSINDIETTDTIEYCIIN